MSDSESTSRRGRRARALSPEESAALESRTAAMVTGEMSPTPGARGAVAAPEADAPVPTLRKFGRRARIIELTDPVDGKTVGRGAPGVSDATDAQTGDAPAEHPGKEAVGPSEAPPPAGPSEASPSAALDGPDRRTAVIDRDRDGTELGELPVSEAPDPRPAPRFDGKVLHRPERSGGSSLLWLVWALIAVALIVLIVLLITGVLGQDTAAAVSPFDLSAPDLSELFPVRPAWEEASA